jgi:hypothetical protein
MIASEAERDADAPEETETVTSASTVKASADIVAGETVKLEKIRYTFDT